VGIAEKVFKVRGQRSEVKDQGHQQTNYPIILETDKRYDGVAGR